MKIKILIKVLLKVSNRFTYFVDYFGLSKKDWVMRVGNMKLKVRKNSIDRWGVTENLILDQYRLDELEDNFDTVIDLGASIGDSTIALANKFKKAKIYAFEPMSDNYKLLLENIKTNNLKSRVRPFCEAVTSDKGNKVQLYENKESALISILKLPKKYIKKFTLNTEISESFVDNYIFRDLEKFIEGKTLLKMDIEGGEYDILSKDNLDILELFDVVVFEYHNLSRTLNGNLIEEFLGTNNFKNYTRTTTHFYINYKKEILFISRPFDGKNDHAGEIAVARNLFPLLEKNFKTIYVKRILFKANLSVFSVLLYDWVYVLCLALTNLFKRYKIVFFNSPYQAFLLPLFKMGGSKCVVLVHDVFFVDNKFKRVHDHYIYWVYKIGLRFADEIISTTEQTKEDLANAFGYKSTVLHLGVSKKFDGVFVFEKKVKGVVGYIGAYCPKRKRAYKFIEMLKLDKDKKLCAHFAGTITEEFINKLKNNIRNYRYAIYGVISTNQKIKFFKKISFLYYPSKLEGTGLPIVESFYSGVLPIVHKDAKIPKVVKEYCVIVDSPEEALEKIYYFLEHPLKFKRIISRNFSHSKIFNYKNYVDYIYKII